MKGMSNGIETKQIPQKINEGHLTEISKVLHHNNNNNNTELKVSKF